MTLNGQWFYLSIQPEPWRVPPLSPGRKGGKLFVTTGSDEQLVTYQRAIKDLMAQHEDVRKWEGNLKLTLYYCRQLGKGIQQADATNLNKALEDALQGVLYENDRAVLDVRGVILLQAETVDDPYVIIHIEKAYTNTNLTLEIPIEVWQQVDISDEPEEEDNVWPPRA